MPAAEFFLVTVTYAPFFLLLRFLRAIEPGTSFRQGK
jgi:hypothetical protein